MGTPYPVFRGLNRSARLPFGVPLIPGMFAIAVVATIALLFGPQWGLLLIPVWIILGAITRNDEHGFRTLYLWLVTRGRSATRAFWGASSYAPSRADIKK